MAFSFNPSPAIIWPAPENCENSISVVPISIVPDVLQTNPKCLFSVPFSTNVKLPFISLSLLKSFVLIQAPDLYKYIPFSLFVIWFFTNILLFSDNDIPSIIFTDAPFNDVKFSVVATNTESLTSKPWTILSTYVCVAYADKSGVPYNWLSALICIVVPSTFTPPKSEVVATGNV